MAKRLILLDRVLVEKIVAPTKSVGGIILPESAVSKVRRAPLPEHRPIGAPPIVGPPLLSVHHRLTLFSLTSIASAD